MPSEQLLNAAEKAILRWVLQNALRSTTAPVVRSQLQGIADKLGIKV